MAVTQMRDVQKMDSKTSKERQAKYRAEMLSKGLKPLSLGYVDERYHAAFKRLVAEVNSGGFSDDLKVKTVVDDSRVKQLEKHIDELRGALAAKSLEADKQIALAKELATQSGSLSERLKAFKQLFWRFYWRS